MENDKGLKDAFLFLYEMAEESVKKQYFEKHTACYSHCDCGLCQLEAALISTRDQKNKYAKKKVKKKPIKSKGTFLGQALIAASEDAIAWHKAALKRSEL